MYKSDNDSCAVANDPRRKDDTMLPPYLTAVKFELEIKSSSERNSDQDGLLAELQWLEQTLGIDTIIKATRHGMIKEAKDTIKKILVHDDKCACCGRKNKKSRELLNKRASNNG